MNRTCRLLQGISNEVEPYFGVNKFQLGRLLLARLQQRLQARQGRSCAGIAPLWLRSAISCSFFLLQPPQPNSRTPAQATSS
jgi:hypothetical protein